MTVRACGLEGLAANDGIVICYMLADVVTGDATAGSISSLDLVLVGGSVVVVACAFYLAIRHTFFPGERSEDHIKRRILKDEDEGWG